MAAAWIDRMSAKDGMGIILWTLYFKIFWFSPFVTFWSDCVTVSCLIVLQCSV